MYEILRPMYVLVRLTHVFEKRNSRIHNQNNLKAISGMWGEDKKQKKKKQKKEKKEPANILRVRSDLSIKKFVYHGFRGEDLIMT